MKKIILNIMATTGITIPNPTSNLDVKAVTIFIIKSRISPSRSSFTYVRGSPLEQTK